MSSDQQQRIVVTCIQERLDNATMVIRLNGKVLGTVVQDSKQLWIVRPPNPEPKTYKTLVNAVDALVDAELEHTRVNSDGQ